MTILWGRTRKEIDKGEEKETFGGVCRKVGLEKFICSQAKTQGNMTLKGLENRKSWF